MWKTLTKVGLAATLLTVLAGCDWYYPSDSRYIQKTATWDESKGQYVTEDRRGGGGD